MFKRFFLPISILLSIAGLSLLVVFASLKGSVIQIVTYSLYGASLVLFYSVRAVWIHLHPEHHLKKRLEKSDHCMIYLLTASTYTPVALLLPNPTWGWSLFGITWGLTTLACLLRIKEWLTPKTLTVAYYSALLILDLVAFQTVHAFLSPSAILWFSLGGICYLSETFLVMARSKPEWAFPFVIAGSFCHFWAFFAYLLP